MDELIGDPVGDFIKHVERVDRGRRMVPVVNALREVGLAPDRFSLYGNLYWHRTLNAGELQIIKRAHEICGVEYGSVETGLMRPGYHETGHEEG